MRKGYWIGVSLNSLRGNRAENTLYARRHTMSLYVGAIRSSVGGLVSQIVESEWSNAISYLQQSETSYSGTS